MLPKLYFAKKFKTLKAFEQSTDHSLIKKRLDYYFKLENKFEVPINATSVRNFKRTKGTDYYLDLKEFLHFFNPETQFAYRFGDETKVSPAPTLVKARPIHGDNQNAVLFKLNKNRHFNFITDKLNFSEKKDILMWRGGAFHKPRRDFVESFWDHPLCDVGQTNKKREEVPWQKDYVSIENQLKCKFIFCPEGNDVATNLKWVMSSNSLCFMPKPKFETWFMEGVLRPGIHYVEVKNDYSDIEQLLKYYSEHTSEALEIIKNAQQHVAQFKNVLLEDLLCLKVLEKYTLLSNQKNTSKF